MVRTHKYHLNFKVKRKQFEKIAAELTGLTPKSVNAMTRIEKNRTDDGRYAPGYRYIVESKRNHVIVTGEK